MIILKELAKADDQEEAKKALRREALKLNRRVMEIKAEEKEKEKRKEKEKEKEKKGERSKEDKLVKRKSKAEERREGQRKRIKTFSDVPIE